MSKMTGTWKWRGKDVPVTFLSGQPYMEVATKIALAHEDGGFTEVSHEFVSVGGKDVVRLSIELKGQRFYGSAQIKWGGKNADATDPIENAETSALGRALSGAGYQINSVASAEDMERVNGARVVESAPVALPAAQGSALTAESCRERAALVGWIGDAYSRMVCEATGKTLEAIRKQGGLVQADLYRLDKRIALLEADAKRKLVVSVATEAEDDDAAIDQAVAAEEVAALDLLNLKRVAS